MERYATNVKRWSQVDDFHTMPEARSRELAGISSSFSSLTLGSHIDGTWLSFFSRDLSNSNLTIRTCSTYDRLVYGSHGSNPFWNSVQTIIRYVSMVFLTTL
ncbi:hypothetical protein KC345_g13 [Hortaea werneckii]|nr:hypothetical protein KC345_g13 [Hortaea werneckii]